MSLHLLAKDLMPRTMRFELSSPRCLPLLMAAAVVLPAASGSAAGYESWSKVEQAPETQEYGLQIRDGKFEPAQQAFITETLLPQLGLEANRATIAAVRQRIRDVTLRGATKNEIVDQANSVLRNATLKVIADKEADLLVRVNAMLLVGELQDLDRAPWSGSLPPLAKAAADATLPLAIRVAAVNGLARHVAAAGAGGAAATVAAPVVAEIVTSPPSGDEVAVRWLVSRALDLLPRVSAPPKAVAAAAALLADDKADIDMRVRAAAAVGGLAKADSGISAAAAIKQIQSLAVTMLSADLEAAEERRFSRQLSGSGQLGGGMPGGRGDFAPPIAPAAGPGAVFSSGLGGELEGAGAPAAVDEDAVPALACRRNAWRLFTLAEAVTSARAGAGLSGLLSGEAATAASDFATTLRQSAIDLDKQPDEGTLKTALAQIRKQAGSDQPATATGQRAGIAQPVAEPSPLDEPAAR